MHWVLAKLVDINFHFAVFAQIAGGILLFNQPELLFGEELYLYGPLRNNLLIMTSYLSVIQLILWFTRYTRNGYPEAMLMGIFLIMTGLGVRFYSTVNHIPLDDRLVSACIYFGLSHVGFFAVNYKSHRRNS